MDFVNFVHEHFSKFPSLPLNSHVHSAKIDWFDSACECVRVACMDLVKELCQLHES